MPGPQDIAVGSLVLKGLIESQCFQSWQDVIRALPNLLQVEVPASITNVVVSNAEPSASQTTSLWVRLDGAGTFIGLYVFSDGAWQPIYPVNTATVTHIFWLYSDDGNPPNGFTEITTGDTVVAPAVVTALMALYVAGPPSYKAYRFSGF